MVLSYGLPNSVTKDHIVPKSRGGRTIVACCYDCNSRKGSKPLFNFLSELYPEKENEQIVSSIFNRVVGRLPGSERMRLASITPRGVFVGKTNSSKRQRHRENEASSPRPQYAVQGTLF